MRKHVLHYGNNKGEDQSVHLPRLIRVFVAQCMQPEDVFTISEDMFAHDVAHGEEKAHRNKGRRL